MSDTFKPLRVVAAPLIADLYQRQIDSNNRTEAELKKLKAEADECAERLTRRFEQAARNGDEP
jgi:hypothetical protein